MRNANPVENTGIIIRRDDGAFLGTCFIFRYPGVVLTADHVVNAYQANQLAVVLPGSRAAGTIFPVHEIHTHPTADLAVVRIEPPDERNITWAVHTLCDDRGYGLDIAAYGYPEHWSDGVLVPMPRFFKGYVQRFFEHSSHLGYKYVAAELSFSCPGGLSGSHILNPQFHGRLYGVITENIRTSTELDSVLEVDEGGKEYKESYHNIINYGIALWLPACAQWLDSVVPPVSAEEIGRRSENQHSWKTK